MTKHNSLLLILLVALLTGLTACTSETDVDSPEYPHNPIALRGIHADIEGAREARAVAPLADQIGKSDFLATDEIVFTLIERTVRPIRPTFSYTGVRYSSDITNNAWKRESPTTDIYWSDGSEPHTFKGYILPHPDEQTAAEAGYDWHHDTERDVYYGSIGQPDDATEVIDYQGSDALAPDDNTAHATERLRREDLLLTYSTEMQNEDAMAWVRFHHGLSSVRVVVTITDYSSTGIDPDAETRVTNMLLEDQPTMYKWDNKSYRAAPLSDTDQQILNSFDDWGSATPDWNQTKDMKLWQPHEYHGEGAARTFTFYGITTPGTQNTVNMTFSVSYPDPLDPKQEARLDKTYTATLDRPVEFRPGYCTSININLNHKDEKMTVGAEYMSWQYIDQPDEGALRKNSTFLSYTERSRVTIVGDEKATVDDATWLYPGTSGKIYDIYGNDGSQDHPYLICTADQLLSFAYEVKNGRTFEHQFIKLDADITLQPSKDVAESQRISWIGIGDADHHFNGFFLGSGRYINGIYGDHFFYAVGDNAVIDKLNFGNVIEMQGCGVVAHVNYGLICGCYIDGDVKENNPSTEYTGSIVGVNQSFIIACAHVGKVSGNGTIGGLVGFNNGTVMACYHCGEIEALDGGDDVHATVGKRGDGTNGTNNSIMFSCYFDSNLITHVPTLTPSKSGYPLTTYVMQSGDFVNGNLNFIFDDDHYTSQGQTLREVLLDILGKDHSSSETEEALMRQLVDEGLTGRVNQVFGYHFSLNKALEAFRLWLNAMPNDRNVQTNCHLFTPLQIAFLKSHYSSEHKFVYVPATYPKVQ